MTREISTLFLIITFTFVFFVFQIEFAKKVNPIDNNQQSINNLNENQITTFEEKNNVVVDNNQQSVNNLNKNQITFKKKAKIIDNDQQSINLNKDLLLLKIIAKRENKKEVIQFVVDKNDFTCQKIFDIKTIKYKKYLLVFKDVEPKIKKCLKLFEYKPWTKNYNFYFNHIIYFDKSTNKVKKELNNLVKLKEYKNYLKKKNINLHIIIDKKELNLYSMKLFNEILNKNIFKNIYLKKDYYLISRNDYLKYLKFKKYLNKLVNNYLNKRWYFYKKNKIKQNLYKYPDNIKCAVYANTENIIFKKYLFFNLINFIKYINENWFENVNKIVIDDYYLKSVDEFKTVFNSIDNYRIYVNKKEKKIWMTSENNANAIKWISFWFSTNLNWKNKQINWKIYSFYDEKFNINWFVSYIYIHSIKNFYHQGIRICSFDNCIQYWPEKGITKDFIYQKIFNHNEVVQEDLPYNWLKIVIK